MISPDLAIYKENEPLQLFFGDVFTVVRPSLSGFARHLVIDVGEGDEVHTLPIYQEAGQDMVVNYPRTAPVAWIDRIVDNWSLLKIQEILKRSLEYNYFTQQSQLVTDETLYHAMNAMRNSAQNAFRYINIS